MSSVTGECLLYCTITDYSEQSGEADHYLQLQLLKIPQKSGANKIFIDRTVTKAFVNNYIEIYVARGSQVLIEIPTIGFKSEFTVPDQVAYNLAQLVPT